ncbi:MAG: MipA/OmpV family protein, partial [Algiphilus sp.]
GMPDLDLSFELGPSLHVDLFERGTTRLWAEWNLRALISADGLQFGHEGFVTDPALYVSTRPVAWARVGARLHVYFADADYHRYFYEVAPAFARADRPAYAASGGYNGSGAGLFADLQPARNWHVRAGLNVRSVHGAAFEDSPLVVEQQGVTVFLTVARSFLHAERRVPSTRGDAVAAAVR